MGQHLSEMLRCCTQFLRPRLESVGLIVAITLLAFLLMKLGGETRYSLLLTLPLLLSFGIYAIFVLVLGVYFD